MSYWHTELQQQVIDRAKEMLKGKPVCLDQLGSDEEIRREGIEECAKTLYIDTLYWEGDFPHGSAG